MQGQSGHGRIDDRKRCMANLGMAYQMAGRDAETILVYKSRWQKRGRENLGMEEQRTGKDDRKRCMTNLGMAEEMQRQSGRIRADGRKRGRDNLDMEEQRTGKDARPIWAWKNR